MSAAFTNIRSLLGALATSMNLINPDMEHHHEQTAYLAYQIALEMGLAEQSLYYTVYAALLHDIGSVVSPEPQTVEQIEANGREVAALGARMLRDLEHFDVIADIIEVNQNSYTVNRELLKDAECPDSLDVSQAIHLADFVTSMIQDKKPILNQVGLFRRAAEACRDTEFSSKAVDAFLRISRREYMWMDIVLNPAFLLVFTGRIREVSLEETVELTRFMSRIIDFRSPFTAMHSAGVAASARELARLFGMSDAECKMMQIAGNLHDLGKLRVPNEILEKPGKLTDEEFNIVKEHPYYTRLILMNVEGFGKIADWAGFHHEKLNGNGYPFHLAGKDLDLGARIMAVADIFSAITEVRPYREGMKREKALDVLRKNVADGAICGEVAAMLEAHYDEIDRARERESREAGQRYFNSLARKAAE